MALYIMAAIIAQIVLFSVYGYVRKKRQLSQTNLQLDGSQKSYEARNTQASIKGKWKGFKPFLVDKKVPEDVNETICSFYLRPVDGGVLPTYKPGQYLTFKLLLKDEEADKPLTVIRCYTLSDSPNHDYYRITVKKVPGSEDLLKMPPGVSSYYFHDHIEVGSEVLVKMPQGQFHLTENDNTPIVLIGGGIGITPMLSILNAVMESNTKREVWLFYGVRNGSEHIMKEHLQQLDTLHENFRLHVCYSNPNPSDVRGLDYQHNNRINLSLLRNTLKLTRYQFYVCGPKAMMESLIPGLREWGVDDQDIFYESFGPATLTKQKESSETSERNEPVSVTFSRSGRSLQWDSDAGSLLEFAENNDIDVDSGCRAGSCGSCMTAISTGEVNYNQVPDIEVEKEHCLLCISAPKSDLVLDA